MSTAAAKNFPVVSGTAARALTGLKPAGGSERKLRTPLSVVRSAPRKRRAPFVVLCFALLAVALMAVLVLNISVSTAQYQLVQLRSDQSTLTKQNQDLTQQVQNFDAPQNLAAKAAELGMVASTGKGQIDLSTLTVSGSPKPAAKGDKPGAVIAAPAVAGQLTVVPPATTRDPLDARKPAEADAPASPAPAAPAAAAPAAAAPKPAVDLHGGSVPAPQQKTPGQ
jgi:cell division protein FtsL